MNPITKKKIVKIQEKEPIFMFGEVEFFTQCPNLYRVRVVNNALVHKIYFKNFFEVIQQYPNDYEIFCAIRDKLLLSIDAGYV